MFCWLKITIGTIRNGKERFKRMNDNDRKKPTRLLSSHNWAHEKCSPRDKEGFVGFLGPQISMTIELSETVRTLGFRKKG